MRTMILSVVAFLAFVSCASAQPQTPDERMRISTVAPDLTAGNWKVVPDKEQLIYPNPPFTVKITVEYYANEKEYLTAYLYVLETNGNRKELAMLYGSANVAKGAIKFEGAWYVSRVPYYDNGKGNKEGTASMEVIPDEKEPTKPVKARIFLETVDGPKEVVIDLK